MTYIIGLTGGIGCGKSLAGEYFRKLGAYIIDADEISHKLSQPPSKALDEIAQAFGVEYLSTNGELDRKKMRTLVFSDAEARRTLEKIFHPLIHRTIMELLKKKIEAPYIILVVPLLFETENYHDIINRYVVVDCPIAFQINRLVKDRHLDKEEAEKIISTQISREKRLSRADDIIDNSHDLNSLFSQITSLHHRYLQICEIN